VQEVLPNWLVPPALVVQVTEPVGTVFRVAVFVAVAVHVWALSTTKFVEVQLTAVVVTARVIGNELLVAPVRDPLEATRV
jgi:hypothetical protein